MAKGLDAMKAKLAAAHVSLLRRTGAALKAEMKIEAAEVRRRTPIDTGALRDSITVSDPVTEGNSITVRINAGGPSAPYAINVHENLESFHEQGQAKFLESTLFESRPYIADRVAARLRRGSEGD